MSFALVVTLFVLVGLIVALALEKWPAELVMLAALLVLVCCGVIKIDDALKGFANEAVLTIAALFVVAAGLEATGAINTLSRLLLGRPKPGTPLLRLFAPVAGLSAFMNNTPQVALMIPIFVHVAKKLRISPSKLLIPLSYAAIADIGDLQNRSRRKTSLQRELPPLHIGIVERRVKKANALAQIGS